MRLPRTTRRAVIAAVLVLLCIPAVAVQQYAIADLGTLGGTSKAFGVNNLGQVVGTSIVGTRTHAFVYKPGVGMVDMFPSLLESYAYGINDSGQVTGYAITDGNARAFVYSISTGGVSWLNTLGGLNNCAYGINNLGQVTGFSAVNTSYPTYYSAFLYTPGVGMRNLGYLGDNTFPNSVSGQAVNSLGETVGYATFSGYSHAIQHKTSTGMVDIHSSLGGSGSSARGINDSGQIVGWKDNMGFIRQESGSVTTFGFNSMANAINNAGQVVGWAGGFSGPSRAFVWKADSGMQSLGTLGGTYSAAQAVSSNGLIAGYAYLGDGSIHGALWSPVPEPSSLLALGSGLGALTLLRRRRVSSK